MRSAPSSPSSYDYRPSAANRATTLLIALLVGALVVFLLIRMGIVPPIIEQSELKTMRLMPVAGSRAAPTRAKAATRASGARQVAKRAVQEHPVTPTPKPTPPPPVPWNVTPMSHEDMVAADISNKPTRAQADSGGAQVADAGGSGSGQGGGDVAGPGEGPDGTQIYNAEWYRRPTDAELSFYLPHGFASDGWGMIACRTAPRYQVEDCRPLDESPGSGLARALREAAWQFRVQPPRINGRPIIGAWVRIRIDFIRGHNRDG